jgi:hypothetical protein
MDETTVAALLDEAGQLTRIMAATRISAKPLPSTAIRKS